VNESEQKVNKKGDQADKTQLCLIFLIGTLPTSLCEDLQMLRRAENINFTPCQSWFTGESK
jgi:hypothetical protein